MRSQRRIKFKKSKSKLSNSADTRVVGKNIAKCAFGDPIRRHYVASNNRRCLSADDLSVFSSALRPCLALLTLGLAAISVTSPAYADDASMTLTVPTSIDLEISPGEGMKWKPSKITIETNAAYGYTLGIKAVGDGSDLVSTENNTISSITASTKDLPSSSWGWRYGEWNEDVTDGDPNDKSFEASPTTSIIKIDAPTPSTDNATKAYYLTIGANIDTDQPKGNYTKDLVITATANRRDFKVTYDTSGGTAVSQGSGSTYTEKATFTAGTSTRTGYVLKGWCSAALTSGSCPTTATTCQAGKSCSPTLAANDTEVKLVAMWENELGINTMQEFGELSPTAKVTKLNSMTTNKEYVLTDKRDGREYFVAKLADNNLWMTENLDLTLSNTKTLTPSDTDIASNWTPVRSTIATGATGWTNTNTTPYSYDPGNRCWNGTITGADYSISSATVTKDCTKHDSSHYHVGNYYNWTAAVAMNDSQSYTTDKQNVNQSICPKGWQLPVYEGNKSFINLKDKTNFTSGSSGTIHQAPFYFPYSGVFESGTSKWMGREGWFWSSVARRSSSEAHALRFYYSGYLQPQDGYHHYNGFSVRCLARSGYDPTGPNSIAAITTMQQYGRLSDTAKTDVLNSMTQDIQYELKDERDGRWYYVSKLADGNIWMTENLDLDLSTSKTLTSDDTDLPAGTNWTPTRSTLTTTTGWANNGSTPYSYDPGDRCWNGTITGTNYPISDDTVAKNCNQHDSSHYHVGNYYNFSAAVAMNDTSGYTTSGTNMDQSICPKGWQLPVNSGNKSFINLKNAAAFTAGTSGNIHQAPFYFPYSGAFGSGVSQNVGSKGLFWSSVARTSSSTYGLVFYNYDGLNPQVDLTSLYGDSIRCVAR